MPKSLAFPVDAIVTKSMVSRYVGDNPPANTPRTEFDVPFPAALDCDKLPKSDVLPVDDVVIKSVKITEK